MIVAGDVALTRFIAETLLGHPLNKQNPDLTGNGWTIARAHSALESVVLLKSSGLRFDVILVDQMLPDRDLLRTLGDVRAIPSAAAVPIFVMSERGRDLATRRLAAESFNVAGFIDKPVTVEVLRRGLKDLERMRMVLLVDANEPRAMKHEHALRRAGFAVDCVNRTKDALRKVTEARPDAVVSAVTLPDKSGIELCVTLKKNSTTHEIPVVLFGTMEEIESQEIEENAHRADEFSEERFGPDAIIDRLTALVGRGASRIGRPVEDRAAQGRGSTEVRPPSFDDIEPVREASGRRAGERSGGSVRALSAEEPNDPTPPPQVERNLPPTQRLVPPVPALAAAIAATADQISVLGNDTIDAVPGGDDDDDPGRTVELRKSSLGKRSARISSTSPPTSASPAANIPGHRAKGRRVPCHLSVSIKEGGTIYKSETLNISDGGILITTDHPLEIGTHIDLSLVLPNREGPITAVGKVAWVSKSSDGRAGVGVKFSRIDPTDLKAVVDYVNRVSRVVYVPT